MRYLKGSHIGKTSGVTIPLIELNFERSKATNGRCVKYFHFHNIEDSFHQFIVEYSDDNESSLKMEESIIISYEEGESIKRNCSKL